MVMWIGKERERREMKGEGGKDSGGGGIAGGGERRGGRLGEKFVYLAAL